MTAIQNIWLNKISAENKNRLIIWVPFALFFAYFWHTYNIFTDVPAYGDTLEVIWGTLWYNHALREWINPLHYPLLFHSAGWQVGTLAHTPTIFLLAQPFYLIGGEAFAFNVLAIIPFFISYIGSLRFFKHYTDSKLTAVVVSLGFTFVTMRSNRAGSHLNILWMTSFLPWLAEQLVLWRQKEETSIWHKQVALSGLYWGLMISFHLYGLFLGPVLFFTLGQKLFQFRKIPQFAFVSTIAFIVGSIAILPYFFATQQEVIGSPRIQELVFWSGNINSIFIPSVSHSVPFVKKIANTLYPIYWGGESKTLNIGITTLLFLALGGFKIWQKPQLNRNQGALLLLVIGIVLALGPILKYSGEPLESDYFVGLNETLWGLGHNVKPDVFMGEEIPAEYANAIPLPGFFLIAVLPKLEGARVIVRFIFVAFLGVLGLVAVGFDSLPKWLRIPLMLIWLIEMLPFQTGSFPAPVADNLHPAQTWLISQPMEQGQGIVDVDERIIHSPHVLFASWQTQWPTASAAGSFHPEQHTLLRDQTDTFVTRPHLFLSRMLRAYDIKYLFIHRDAARSESLWEYLGESPQYFNQVECFQPIEGESTYYDYSICVVEVLPHPAILNAHPIYGLSDEEPWGMWAIEDRPRFNFVATVKKPYVLEAEVFPHCVEGQNQSLQLVYDEDVLYEYKWENCDPISFQTTIPAENINIGFNEIHFEFDYAISPAELGTGNDPRTLSVGFSQLEIKSAD